MFFSGRASDQQSGTIIIWSDRRVGEGGVFFTDGLFGQRLDENGNRLWGAEDVALSIKNVRHNTYKVISDYAGGAIVCWYEAGAGSGAGIFAQQISRNGKLGEVLTTSVSEPVINPIPLEYVLHQSYPNPFNSSMVIKYEIPQNTFVQLRVLDLSGKEVIELVNKEQRAGIHKVTWNGKNQTGGDVVSGIYFYQLRAGSFVKTRKTLLMK